MANKKFADPKDRQIHDALTLAYDALKQKGYKPYVQLSSYILSGDECYITTFNKARETLTELDGEEIILHLLAHYFEN